MHRIGIRPPAAAVLAAALLAACASGETDASADTAAAMSAASDSTVAMSCYLQGATLDEARARPSPLGEVRFSLNGQEALLCYGRPSAKGRTVMGDLVPYGAPWRLGANEATAIHLPMAASIGTVAVEPGSYSLYAVPAASEWEIVVNTNVQRWGIPISDEVMSSNVGSFKAPVSATSGMVEQLTFTWEGTGADAGQLIMEWENARVAIPVAARAP
jgi:hypothetical protein